MSFSMAPIWFAPFGPAQIPVVPGADEARRLAQEELAQQIYQDAKPGWPAQLLAFLKQALSEFLNGVGVPNGSIGFAIVVIIAVLAIVAVVLIARPRLNRRKKATEALFSSPVVLSARQHRQLAAQAAAVGDFPTAVSEEFRAMVRAAEERDVCAPAAGRTAVEVTAELVLAFPRLSADLHHAADVFNGVRYGAVPATSTMYQELSATDAALDAARPVYATEFVDAPEFVNAARTGAREALDGGAAT